MKLHLNIKRRIFQMLCRRNQSQMNGAASRYLLYVRTGKSEFRLSGPILYTSLWRRRQCSLVQSAQLLRCIIGILEQDVVQVSQNSREANPRRNIGGKAAMFTPGSPGYSDSYFAHVVFGHKSYKKLTNRPKSRGGPNPNDSRGCSRP